jgi:hypothetical protein
VQKSLEVLEPKVNRTSWVNHVLSQTRATTEALSRIKADMVACYKQTMRKSLMREVMPAVVASLIALAEERPLEPLAFMSDFLLQWSDEKDQARQDPYDAHIYAERRQMNHEKAEDRKVAIEAKLKREKDARAAADTFLREMLLDSMRKHESMLRS